MGEPGQRIGGLGQDIRQAAADGGALSLDGLALGIGQPAELEKPVDEEPEAEVGRQAPRRGMGGVEEASAITLRMVAGDSATPSRREIVREPTGSPLST